MILLARQQVTLGSHNFNLASNQSSWLIVLTLYEYSLSVQRAFADNWASSSSSAYVHVAGTVEEAVDLVEDLGDIEEAKIFVTGSFHLVGGVISILEGIQTPVSPISPPSGRP